MSFRGTSLWSDFVRRTSEDGAISIRALHYKPHTNGLHTENVPLGKCSEGLFLRSEDERRNIYWRATWETSFRNQKSPVISRWYSASGFP